MDSQVDPWTHFWNYFKPLLSLGDRVDVEHGIRQISVLRGFCIILKISTTGVSKGKALASPYPAADISALGSIHLSAVTIWFNGWSPDSGKWITVTQQVISSTHHPLAGDLSPKPKPQPYCSIASNCDKRGESKIMCAPWAGRGWSSQSAGDPIMD